MKKARFESIYSMKEEAKAISLKALVDKGNNRVIFAESDEDFTDVLFSFLTMPIGTIIRLISNHNKPPTVRIGCMNNLYESIKKLDMQLFRDEACKTMLLCSGNRAAPQNKRLKLQIDDGELPRYFLCTEGCTFYQHKLLSLYPDVVCECGRVMDKTIELSEKTVLDPRDRGVFVKGLTRFIISDELQVKPSSIEASLSVLSKLGLMDCSNIAEYNMDIGLDEVLTLLKCSLVSKKPLTETLLKQNSPPKLGKEDFDQNIYAEFTVEEPESNVDGKIHVESIVEEPKSNVDGKIHVKLIVSKSKKMVCYAEASDEFVDLVSSFLTVPLGYIVKVMQSSISKGSLTHLYSSVHELDAEKYLKSNEHKEMLINPKLAPGVSYENPLGIEEGLHPTYCASVYDYEIKLTCDSQIPSGSASRSSILTIKDAKSHSKEATRGGFLTGPTMFTITDNLIITPISQVQNLSLLKKLKVPFSDLEERVVHVGSEKALRLMVASFVSESVLTDVFLREPNPKN